MNLSRVLLWVWILGVVLGQQVNDASGRCEQGCVKCVDPRGCPDLIVSENFLGTGMILDTRSFDPSDCNVQEGQAKPGTQRLLRFNYATPNIGQGKLVVGNPSDHRDWFDCENCHGHCHFNQYADYRLWTPQAFVRWRNLKLTDQTSRSKEILAQNQDLMSGLIQGQKRGFCVGDVMRCDPFGDLLNCALVPSDNSSFPIFDPATCASNQGISVGWADLYESSLDGQWIIVPDEGGIFVLEVEANAERFFEERNYLNNIARVCVNVPPVDPAARAGFVPNQSCVTPKELNQATECQMCEASCESLRWCSTTDSRMRCGPTNCFCSSFCPNYAQAFGPTGAYGQAGAYGPQGQYP